MPSASVGRTGTGSILLGARPTEPVIVQPDRNGRDIMLCLDVSASMDPWNRQVVDSFRQLLDGLNGERIGLTIFSGLAVTVFPLTDDYQYVDTKLDEAEAAFTGDSFDYFVGAEALALRASQSGDGLMSCLQRMTVNRDKRARAVVLATDNDPVGRGIFVLPEAAESAARGGVVVYGIGTPDMKPKQSEEFAAAAASTGGAMTVVQDGEGVDDLVRAIQKLERDRLRPVPTGVVVDDPATPFAIAVAGMVVLLGGALVGRRRR